MRRRCKTLRFGAHIAAVLVPLQIFVGDLHGLNTLEHQPAKIAAMEALWKTERGAPLTLFGIPEREGAQQRLRDHACPKAQSLILAHDAERRGEGPGRVRGPRRRWRRCSSHSASWSAWAC